MTLKSEKKRHCKARINSCETGNGFTLLEVLVAFTLLTVLLTVIIQSQSESIFFIKKTGKRSAVQREVINELLKAERLFSTRYFSDSEGKFEDDHPLVGDFWEKKRASEEFLGLIPVTRIIYRVSWIVNDEKRSFQSAIFGEIR